ncbi:MAG TPA: mevalonate kinase [Anaerolineae bacterium]|nr:mevalonate kinase [Anaerolineae bacterium]
MPAVTATAPGKIILFGEHAVVYGQPALAVPVQQVQARAVISAAPDLEPGEVLLTAPEVNLQTPWSQLPPEHPLVVAIRLTLTALGMARPPALRIRITSTIPVAAGLGSGAAVSVALVRALSRFLGHPLDNAQVNAIAFEVEKIHHGTPSGIDNTVVTYAMPVYFVRGRPVETFRVKEPFTLVIGDTDVPSPTAKTVAEVRRRWQQDPATYEALFAAIGRMVNRARRLIQEGQPAALGPLMDENHALLRRMGVSSPKLDALVAAAKAAGALGAKLSGGGRGGNMIALAPDEASAQRIAHALRTAGAVRTLVTTVR